jgi:hypothetical protein
MPERKKQIPHPAKPAKSGSTEPLIQGEGDYISAGRYQKAAHRFAKEHDIERLARAAAPRNDAERREMAEAEKKGKARAGKTARR